MSASKPTFRPSSFARPRLTILPWVTPMTRRHVRMSSPPGTKNSGKNPHRNRSLASSHTRTAVNVLAAIMRSKDATAAARVSAANAILDRGWGKATQPVGNDDGTLELIHRIERVIVHPENTDS